MLNYGFISDQKKNSYKTKRKKTDKIYFPITNIGSVTLMMIFIVVCMVSFAALSLSTAGADYRAAKKSAKHVTNYYKASNDAEEKLAGLSQLLSESYADSKDSDSYYKDLEEKLQAMEGFSSIAQRIDGGILSGISVSYDCSISKKQALHVEILCTYPQDNAKEDLYQITCWQTISTSQWEGDNSIKLIGQ